MVRTDGMNMYCLLEDGTWARFTSDDNAGAPLKPFRAYFLSDEPINTSAAAPAQTQDNNIGTKYRTLFSNAGAGNVSDGNVPDAFNILYDGDIPNPSSTTSIEPTIQTINADGTSRYFDLQGRQLNGKPNKGIYIQDGKKVVTK